MYEFRWNTWNIGHIAEHGVRPQQAESVINHTRPPWPDRVGNGKFRVYGRADNGAHLQVIYVLDPDDTVFVIHARPLTPRERQRYRRRCR